MGNNSEVSKLVVDKDEFKKQLEERIELGNQILWRGIPSEIELDRSHDDYREWDEYNILWLRNCFQQIDIEHEMEYSDTTSFGLPYNRIFLEQKIREFRNILYGKIKVLTRLISKIPLLTSEKESSPMDKTQVVYSNKIFIVHGHNNAVKFEVARFIEKLDLKPIILHEQANAGKTIIEQFESHANVGFAVILLTGDDVGKVKNAENDSPRARQNVILEWGFFIGKLGRNRVCALYEKGVELPSDLHGLLYVSLDDHDWQRKLAKELKAAGYEIDGNKLL